MLAKKEIIATSLFVSIIFIYSFIDSIKLSKIVFPYLPSYKLGKIIRSLGIGDDSIVYHDARGDVEATKLLIDYCYRQLKQ